jgi:hypothetical protein
LYHIVEEKDWEREDWNLAVFQDDVYGVLSRQELRELRKFPSNQCVCDKFMI